MQLAQEEGDEEGHHTTEMTRLEEQEEVMPLSTRS